MSNYLIPHPPSTVEQMRQAVTAWQAAAAHERFRIAHGLCCGSTSAAAHNANLYDATARDIQREIDARTSNCAQGSLALDEHPAHDQ